MYIKQATVNNQVGLHARPATFFIQKANEFKSTIWVEKDDQRVNAKSLLGVLSLGIIKGSTIDLIADGTDEKEVIASVAGGLKADCAAAGMEFNWFNTVDGVEFLDYVTNTALARFGVTEDDGTELYQNFDVQVYYSRLLDLRGA